MAGVVLLKLRNVLCCFGVLGASHTPPAEEYVIVVCRRLTDAVVMNR